MTNGEQIRQFNNEELAKLIYGFIMISKDNAYFKNIETAEDSQGYKILLELLNEEVNYE